MHEVSKETFWIWEPNLENGVFLNKLPSASSGLQDNEAPRPPHTDGAVGKLTLYLSLSTVSQPSGLGVPSTGSNR